ncbi:hypothetical protein H4R33_003391 [Dimargaris cristalligena]|nr:hypothetical protein H4R33_003391 [Dimargaris cristalligena]
MEAVLNATVASAHPYFPISLALPHYAANTLVLGELLGYFSLCVVAVGLVAAFLLTQRPQLSALERATFIWFLVSGCIHLFFEGYFVYNHATLAGDSSLFGQLWKEYSLSDSRYLSSDSFVLLMELVTAVFDGPLCFVAAYGIYSQSPVRHIAQALVSLAQLYGDVLYYATTLFEGSPHCTPHPYYFWFYFGFMNFIWIIVPTSLCLQSCTYLYRAVARVQALDGRKKVQ